jgi:hypothetical protein
MRWWERLFVGGECYVEFVGRFSEFIGRFCHLSAAFPDLSADFAILSANRHEFPNRNSDFLIIY